jgi:hypothetical protein
MDTSQPALEIFRIVLPYDPARSFLVHQSAARAQLLDELDSTGYERTDSITYQRDGNSFTATAAARPARTPFDARPWESSEAWADDLFDVHDLTAERWHLRSAA